MISDKVATPATTKHARTPEEGMLRLPDRDIPYVTVRSDPVGVCLISGLGADYHGPRARYLQDKCIDNKFGFTAFSYSGLDGSGNKETTRIRKIVTQWTFPQWIDDANQVFTHVTSGPQIIVASCFGAMGALRTAEKNANRVNAVILISPAIEVQQQLVGPYTERRGSPERKAAYQQNGYFDMPIPGGSSRVIVRVTKEKVAGYEPVLRQMQEEGIKLTCPVTVAVGPDDPVVTEDAALRVLDAISAPKKKFSVINGIGHRRTGESNYSAMWNLVRAFLPSATPV